VISDSSAEDFGYCRVSSEEQGVLDQDRNWINEGIAWYGDPMA